MTLTLLLVVVPISIGRAADATGWTPELKDKEVTTCRVAVVNRIIAKAARAANTSPDDIRGKLKADSLAEASLEAEFSFACKCFIGKVAAGMSHADYMARPSQTIGNGSAVGARI